MKILKEKKITEKGIEEKKYTTCRTIEKIGRKNGKIVLLRFRTFLFVFFLCHQKNNKKKNKSNEADQKNC